VRGYSSLGVGEEAPISLSDECQKLVDFNTGIDRKGRAFESLEAGLLSLQDRREHHSQGTTLLVPRQSGPGLFKQKMIEGPLSTRKWRRDYVRAEA